MSNVTRSAFAAILVFIVGPAACRAAAPNKPVVTSAMPTTSPAQSDATAPKNETTPAAEPATNTSTHDGNRENGRPSAQEWAKAQSGEIERAAELGCQVTAVRDWVRIDCGPKTTKGAKIVDIRVFLECQNGSCTSHTDRAFIQRGHRILEEPLREGYEIKANFVWDNGAEELRLQWPKGQPKPTKLGAFTTNSDIDPATLHPQLRAIECCIEVQGEGTCLGKAGGYADGPCFKAFQKDCKKLVACQMGELPPPCASSPNGCDE